MDGDLVAAVGESVEPVGWAVTNYLDGRTLMENAYEPAIVKGIERICSTIQT